MSWNLLMQYCIALQSPFCCQLSDHIAIFPHQAGKLTYDMSLCAKNISKFCGEDFKEAMSARSNKSSASLAEIEQCNTIMINDITGPDSDVKKCTSSNLEDCQCYSDADDKMTAFQVDCFSSNNAGAFNKIM